MSTFLDKFFNIIITQSRKLPHALIVIFIFTSLLPNEAATIIHIISRKILILLPDYILEFVAILKLSPKETLALWGFLLIVFAITLIIDISAQLLLEERPLRLKSGTERLLELNSVFYLSILVYNTLYPSKIKLSSILSVRLYSFLFLFSLSLFLLFFFISYCDGFIFVQKRIENSDFSIIHKLILHIILLCLICLFATMSFSILV